MKLRAWRIIKRKHGSAAFDGEGARQYGGRWNSIGKRMIYTAESISLGLLEMLVHTDSSLLPNYMAFPVHFDDSRVSTIESSKLPSAWRAFPAPSLLKSLGDEWLESMSSPVLRVPNAIVPVEWNYLLNPEHPEFPLLEIGDAVSVEIDLRLRDE